MGYTKKDKQLLIRHLKQQRDMTLDQLDQQMYKRANHIKQQIQRRLNGVSVTLYNVKLKDSLAVERKHQLSTKSLIRDIQLMKRSIVQQHHQQHHQQHQQEYKSNS